MRLAVILLACLPLCGQVSAPADGFATCGAVYALRAGVACTVGLAVAGNTYTTGTLVALGQHNTQQTLFVDAADKIGVHGSLSLWLTGGLGIPTGGQLTTGSVNPGAFVSYGWKSGLFIAGGCRVIVPLSPPQVARGVRVDTQTYIGVGLHFSKPQ